MENMMEYRQYLGSVHYIDADGILYDKVESICSLISSEGEEDAAAAALQHEFEAAAENDWAWCEEKGLEPAQV